MLGIPTESSYGLAVDPLDPRGVAVVFRVKRRGAGGALPVVVADLEQARSLGVVPDAPGLAIALELWPAPLTLVVPLAAPIAASAGSRSLAVRIPDHPRLRDLLRRTGPLTATSANRSGEPPLLEASAVAELLAGVRSLVIDDGPSPGGAPSTLVRWEGDGFRVLRSGRFPIERLPRATSPPVKRDDPPARS